MQIKLTGEIADHVLALAKKDSKLAQALAQQFLATTDPWAMARYLLGGGAAMAILTARLTTDPRGTVAQLQRLPTRAEEQVPARGRGAKQIVATEKPARRRGRHKRQRLSEEQAEKIKAGVRAFLGKHPAASRKALTKAVRFPSAALYNRIMGELKKAGEVMQKGEKSKTVYSLKKRRGA
jgi:hypothetical protein